MLSLVILGQLLDKPAHGYAIKQTLDQLLGSRKISWGSLYPVLNKLEKDSYIKKIKSRTPSGGPTQKTYSITGVGEKHFYSLMAQPLADSDDTRSIFRYKLLFFDKIKKDERIIILKDYAKLAFGRFLSIKNHLEEYKKRFSQSKYILEVLEHSLRIYRSEKYWVDRLLSREDHD